nr:MAG TPA: hypothetical protein [Caudoviricetes sp.]
MTYRAKDSLTASGIYLFSIAKNLDRKRTTLSFFLYLCF